MAMRYSKDFTDRWVRLQASDADISPVLRTTFQYAVHQRRTLEAKGRKLSFRTRNWDPVDPSYDPFANSMMRILLALENLLHVSCNHEEVLLALIAARGVYERLFDLKFNIVFTGPPASGKSYITKCIMDYMSIAGTCKSVAHKTEKADNTDVDLCAQVTVHDELPEWYFEAGTGKSSAKQVLSDARLVTSSFHLTEDGQRVCIETEAKLQTVNITCTNGKTTDIAEPLRTRMFIRVVPLYDDRPGHGYFDHYSRGASMTDAQRKERDAFCQDMRTYQFMYSQIYTSMHVGRLEKPDMENAILMFRVYAEKLAERGIKVQQRQGILLLRFAQSLVIHQAIHNVFFSNRVFKLDKEFEYNDVLACQYFMYSTDQIATYTFSQLGDMFVMPYMVSVSSHSKAVATDATTRTWSFPKSPRSNVAMIQKTPWRKEPRMLVWTRSRRSKRARITTTCNPCCIQARIKRLCLEWRRVLSAPCTIPRFIFLARILWYVSRRFSKAITNTCAGHLCVLETSNDGRCALWGC